MGIFLKDLIERTVATYVQVFLGLIIATSTDMVDINTLKVAAISALPAALAVAKGLIAKRFGDPNSASLVD